MPPTLPTAENPSPENASSLPETDPRLILATARLKTAGLRVTQPRMTILEALCRQTSPVSIEYLHAGLPAGACDLVTVYRCMAAFERGGLVRRAVIHQGTSLYQVAFGQPETYHVVCRSSGTLAELSPEVSGELQKAVAKAREELRVKGYREVAHMLEFSGVAPPAAPR
ncbi:MAG: transcriptional repressor [Verrucomicrobia bacterium]|nr:transcriptional repressor [Verrucomicrobiota bacterium]